MPERRIYLLGLLDSASQQTLDGVTTALGHGGLTGRQTPGLPFHITLGDCAVAQQAALLDRAAQVCGQTRPIDIHISHIGLFGQGVLFAAPTVNHELLTLHDRLFPTTPTQGCHNWVPHTTLFIGDPPHVQAALPIVWEVFSHVMARIERVDAYAFFPAEHLATFTLAAAQTDSRGAIYQNNPNA